MVYYSLLSLLYTLSLLNLLQRRVVAGEDFEFTYLFI